MAGRSYHLSADISSSLSAVSETKPAETVLKDAYYDDFEIDELDHYLGKTTLSPKFQLWIFIVAATALLTALCIYFVAVYRYDYRNGASTSNELVEVIPDLLNHFEYDKIKTYVPREIRDSEFISDSDVFAKFREQTKEEIYTFKNSSLESEVPFDDLESLQEGLLNTYGIHINISSAKLITMRLLFVNHDKQSVNVLLNIIPIKVYHKWYLYTGEAVSYEGKPVDFMTFLEDKTDQGEEQSTNISYVDRVEEKEADKTESEEAVEKTPDVKLDFYKEAKSDLLAGKCKINDMEYVIPCDFSSFSDVFVLDTDRIKSKTTAKLKMDETLGNVPVSFIDESFAEVPVYITLGNLSSEDVKLQDASVTTLYVGASDPSLNILLPGNVTFGTSYEDVVKMYGELNGGKDSLFHGELADNIYSLPLSNHKRNKIYFGFKDDKLVEIQWYYIDMTDYREI